MTLPMNMPVGIATCYGRVWVGWLTEWDNHGIGCWRIMRGGGAGIVANDVAGGTIPIVGIPI